jgi:putative transcriptional regulator
MTKADLSRATGIRQKTVGELCNDRVDHIPVKTMDALCNYFNCQPNDLWEWIPNMDSIN